MKSLFLLLCAVLLQACADEPSLGESGLDTKTPYLTQLDHWIRDTYTTPYNVAVRYRWNESEVDMNRYLFPPSADKVQPALEIIQDLWVMPYEKVKPGIIKKIAPRVVVLVGGENNDSQGSTRVLGQAEGGKKIVMFEVDLLDTTDAVSATRFVSTIQHEYTHILNQTVPFNERGYEDITTSLSNYRSDWDNYSSYGARADGFITPYASSAVVEDIAEMVRVMLSNTKAEFDKIINDIRDEKAEGVLRRKEALVAEYFKKGFGIDIYELQREVSASRAKIGKSKEEE